MNTKLSKKLSHFLADTFVLYVKTLNFHWNMVGPHFYMFHKLLQEQYEELAEAADTIAEQIRMRGEKAPGSMKEMLDLTCMNEAKDDLPWHKMIDELIIGHEELIEHGTELIEEFTEEEDYGVADMLTDRIRAHDKAAWLLRSHQG